MEISSLLAALVFMAANVMKTIFLVEEFTRGHWDEEAWKALDMEYIEEEWDFRLSKKALFLASGFLNAIAWTLVAWPVLQLAWLLSRQGTMRLPSCVGIGMCAIGGAMTEWLGNLFWIGTNVASTQLVNKFNLDFWLREDVAATLQASPDGLGWKTLETNYIIGSGFIWFIDSFEWLCVFGIFTLTFVSVKQWRAEDLTTFGLGWNCLTLFIGLLSLLEFVAEILRFEGFKYFGPIAFVWGCLNRIILLPAWIISLGFILPRAMLKQRFLDGAGNVIDGELALSEVNSEVPTFTIGDDDGEPVTQPSTPASPVSPPPEAFGKGGFAASPEQQENAAE